MGWMTEGSDQYDPFEQYLQWQRRSGLGNANMISPLLPNTLNDWSVNPSSLVGTGAPQEVVNAAQQQGPAGNNAMQFLERLRQMFGQQLQSRFPGIENTDLNSWMGGKIGYSPADPADMSQMDILKAMQQGMIFNQDPMR